MNAPLDRREFLTALGLGATAAFLPRIATAATDHRTRSATARVSSASASQLDERSQRSYLVERHLSPLLPAQPARRCVGRHALGPRRQRGHDPLAPQADRACADSRRPRQRGLLQRLGCCIRWHADFYLYRRAECAARRITTPRREPTNCARRKCSPPRKTTTFCTGRN